MALPAAYAPISLGQIQSEFTGFNPIAISEYYREPNGLTTPNNTNVPTSGIIALSNFYSAVRSFIVTVSFTREASFQNYFYLDSPGLPRIVITTTVNGGGSTRTYYIPANTTFTVRGADRFGNIYPNSRIRLRGNRMELEDGADNDFNDLTATPDLGEFTQSGGSFYYVLNV